MLSIPSTSNATTCSTTAISNTHSHSTACKPFPNPNNKVTQPTYNAEIQNFQTNILDPNDIHLGSERVFQRIYSLAPIEEQHPKEEYSEETIEAWTTFDGEQPLEPRIEEFI